MMEVQNSSKRPVCNRVAPFWADEGWIPVSLLFFCHKVCIFILAILVQAMYVSVLYWFALSRFEIFGPASSLFGWQQLDHPGQCKI
jgi:hypothetical protein